MDKILKNAIKNKVPEIMAWELVYEASLPERAGMSIREICMWLNNNPDKSIDDMLEEIGK